MLVNGRVSAGTSGSSGSTSAPHGQPSPRPSSTARGNVAAFLTKLYNMVNDEASNSLIKWSDDGQSFIVLRHVDFAKEVLPKFFKHNNFSSFVRQLNMYGFHKVPHLQQGVLLPDSDSEQWEFSNPHFQKNQPDLLCLVSRKKASNGNEDKDPLTMDLGHILQEVTAIKKHQIAISSDLKNIERDHQSLWQESIAARDRHQRQQETIDKILRFLASVFSGDKKRAIVPHKRPRLTITEGDIDDEYDNEMHTFGDEHEDEVTELLGDKRKRSSVELESDFNLPDIESHETKKPKSIPNSGKMSPANLAYQATLGLLENSGKSAQPSFGSSSTSNNISAATSLPVASTSASQVPQTYAEIQPSLPDYLKAIPSSNYPEQSFKLDSPNLAIPTAFFPNSITPVHHDMLRSISMANAQEATPPPLPQSFAQTPAGANAIKGVDDITKEMEQLQKSIEALEAHGLNANNFNFDHNYLNSGAFDPSAYGDLTSMNSGDPYQDSLENDNDMMNDMIHTDHDDLSFVAPEQNNNNININNNNQYKASRSTTPISLGSSTASLQASSPVLTSPELSIHSPNVQTNTLLSPITQASTVSAQSASGLTSTELNNSKRRISTVGDEHQEALLHMDGS
ncbi:stress-responsive transcription factor hsf1 [Entomortierella beljakovae]|nr:stress-responsive transcription factor hsf1 [Entomortierella beljakovae]